MDLVSASIVIKRPIEEVFDYTASPFNGPVFIPNLNENTNIHPEKPGVGQTFNWRFNMAGVDLTGKAEALEYDRPRRVKLKTSGDSNSVWVFEFQEVDGGTKVTAGVEYEIHESILKKIANAAVLNRINQKSSEQMLDNLKTVLEG